MTLSRKSPFGSYVAGLSLSSAGGSFARRFALQVWIGLSFCSLFSPSFADMPLPEVVSRPALMLEHPAHAMMLGGARAGARLVAVGLHGVIILSDDNGLTWRQAPSPTSVTLTDATFASRSDGWIIGHMGVVLHTTDGGESWVRQLDGRIAAALALEAAEHASARSDDQKQLKSNLTNARQLSADGPDKPFLAIMAEDPKHVLVAGAYGIAFQTSDAGAHWLPVLDRFDDDGAWHIYALARSSEAAYAAGEQGLFLHARGNGPFVAGRMPAQLSVFGLVMTAKERLVAYGLNGLIEYSDDQGAHWTPVDAGLNSSITSGISMTDGTVLLATQLGQVLVSRDDGMHFRVLQQMAPQQIAGLMQAADGGIVTLGPAGAGRIVLDKLAGNS
jgi:photosystem II stability/assembly factor-like uncharacterized protein